MLEMSSSFTMVFLLVTGNRIAEEGLQCPCASRRMMKLPCAHHCTGLGAACAAGRALASVCFASLSEF